MTDNTNRCLTAPEILAFLGGELQEGRRAEIQAHLDVCRLCEAAVQGVAGLEWREGFLRSTDSLLARVRTRTAAAVTAAAAARPPARRPLLRRLQAPPQYLFLAATLVIGAGTAVLLSRPGPGDELFQQYFEPYPSTRPTVRGASPDAGSGALPLYEARDYEGALAAFDERLSVEPNDGAARFYAGICRLELGRLEEAESDLDRVVRLGDRELLAPAEWYLALIKLKAKDPEAARPRLEKIASGGGFYQEKARRLLSELDRISK